jgi:molybdopterin synthase catalytic subunit
MMPADPSPMPPAADPAPAAAHSAYVLSSAPINLEVQPFLSPSLGAQLQFLGVVRGLEEGRPISGIAYSAYEPMARSELQQILNQGATDLPAHAVFIEHRLGFVPAGQPSLRILCSSAHSAAAFEACRWYLSRIKASVPIWKAPQFIEPEAPQA